MLIHVLLGLAQAIAQPDGAAAAGVPGAPCSVVNVNASSAKAADLYLVCGLSALRLGNADQYSSSYNPSLDALVVVRQDGGRTEVSVASGLASGQGPHVDDISREVLRSATGRNADRGAAAVDVTSFAASGRIAVTAAPADRYGAAATSQFDVAADLGRAAAGPGAATGTVETIEAQ